MSTPSRGARVVLRDPNLLLYLGSRFLGGMAATCLRAAFFWHVSELTGSAFALGLVGLAQFVPTLSLVLLGGALADRYERRRLVMAAQAAALVVSLALAVAVQRALLDVGFLFVGIVATAAAAAFEGPARSALLPTLVPRPLFASAVTVHATVQQLGWVAGPVLMGLAIDAFGLAAAYALHAGLTLLSLLTLTGVRTQHPSGPRREVSVAAIREGLSFVRGRPAVLGAMTLDMFAVIFASATALLPIYAHDILAVGARGYGALASAMEIGTFAMALLLVVLPPIVRPGRALLLAVGAYGVATVAFGVSRSFALSFAAFVLAGMADQVSMVTRATLIQLATPDALRGRVSAVNLVFIGASNQLGAVESGFVASLTSAPFSVVSGGVACLAALAVVAWRVPELRRWRWDEGGGSGGEPQDRYTAPRRPAS